MCGIGIKIKPYRRIHSELNLTRPRRKRKMPRLWKKGGRPPGRPRKHLQHKSEDLKSGAMEALSAVCFESRDGSNYGCAVEEHAEDRGCGEPVEGNGRVRGGRQSPGQEDTTQDHSASGHRDQERSAPPSPILSATPHPSTSDSLRSSKDEDILTLPHQQTTGLDTAPTPPSTPPPAKRGRGRPPKKRNFPSSGRQPGGGFTDTNPTYTYGDSDEECLNIDKLNSNTNTPVRAAKRHQIMRSCSRGEKEGIGSYNGVYKGQIWSPMRCFDTNRVILGGDTKIDTSTWANKANIITPRFRILERMYYKENGVGNSLRDTVFMNKIEFSGEKERGSLSVSGTEEERGSIFSGGLLQIFQHKAREKEKKERDTLEELDEMDEMEETPMSEYVRESTTYIEDTSTEVYLQRHSIEEKKEQEWNGSAAAMQQQRCSSPPSPSRHLHHTSFLPHRGDHRGTPLFNNSGRNLLRGHNVKYNKHNNNINAHKIHIHNPHNNKEESCSGEQHPGRGRPAGRKHRREGASTSNMLGRKIGEGQNTNKLGYNLRGGICPRKREKKEDSPYIYYGVDESSQKEGSRREGSLRGLGSLRNSLPRKRKKGSQGSHLIANAPYTDRGYKRKKENCAEYYEGRNSRSSHESPSMLFKIKLPLSDHDAPLLMS